MGKKKKGFSLTELLVAVSILGLLATFVVTRVGGAQVGARDKKRIADLLLIQSALELYFADNRVFPITGDGKFECYDILFPSCVNRVLFNALLPRYLAELPKDPKRIGNFTYYYLSDEKVYALQAALEGKNYRIDANYQIDTAGSLRTSNRCGYLDNRSSDGLIYYRICSIR